MPEFSYFLLLKTSFGTGFCLLNFCQLNFSLILLEFISFQLKLDFVAYGAVVHYAVILRLIEQPLISYRLPLLV